MLETIGESIVRTTTRADHHVAADNRTVDLKKAERAVAERPIEGSAASQYAESDAADKSGAYDIDDGDVYYEKYDRRGNVIYRLPPEKKPIDEHV